VTERRAASNLTAAPRRILVVALDNLGDSIMGAATLNPLRALYPQAAIGYWVKKYVAGLYEEHPLLDEVHAADPFWDVAPGRPKGSFAEFKIAFMRIREKRYDAAIILNTEWRRSLACYLAQIPIRVGFDRRHSRSFLTHAVRPASHPQHFVDDHRQLIETLNDKQLSPDLYVPHIVLSSREKEWSEKWIANLGWKDSRVIAIHPTAGDEKKCWPPHKWRELIRLLSGERETNFLIFGGAHERKLIEAAFDELAVHYHAMIGAELGHVKAVLSHAHLFIGGDSGIGHLAAALGIPVVSLFGATDPRRCAPLGSEKIEIVRHNPLNDLAVSEAAANVKRMLETTKNA
jgi:ADP-heptose:LPS heptosyltransferase